MDSDRLNGILEKLRAKRPLVHNITNFVVMNTTANAILALGASPIMAHSPEELEELVSMADSIVINIGTLDSNFIYSMLRALEYAGNLGKPVILDPVGAGATRLRTNVSIMLLETGGVSVVRGNYGEIAALIGEMGKTKGVDRAEYSSWRAVDVVRRVAEKFNIIASVTGPVDYVSNGRDVYAVEVHSPPLLDEVIHRVTGLGCIVSAIIGSYLAVEEPLLATIAGLATFRVTALKAVEEAPYPGSFHAKIYDWLYRITSRDIVENTKVYRVGS